MMRRVDTRPLLAVGVLLLIGLPYMPAGTAADDWDGGVRSPMLSTPPEWYDALDDSSHVYVPPVGLVGVEVTGGEARLLSSASVGWVASSIITCPDGYIFDYARITYDAPGGSRVLVSILNASKEPSVAGYANETVPGLADLERGAVSLYGLSKDMYPRVRMQVDLVANGSFKPTLLDWRMVFGAPDEWHDPFVGLDREGSRGDLLIGNGYASVVSDGIPGGLLGHYYDDRDLSVFKYTKDHEVINFNWGNNGPAGLDVNTFSIRWVGTVEAPVAGQYTFYLTVDDGGRLWIDGTRLVDKWFDQAPTEYPANVQLTKGRHDLKVEYYENNGGASCQLRWSSSTIAKQIVPGSVMRTPQNNVLVSDPINLVPGQRWDVSRVVRTADAGGTIAVDVIDTTSGMPIPAFTAVMDEYMDLSLLSPFQYTTIKLRATWSVTDLATAPRLLDWSVGWMPRGTWRERFDFTARVDRLVNADLADSMLRPEWAGGTQQLLVTGLRSDAGYNIGSTMYLDAAAPSLLTAPRLSFPTAGASAADVEDIDGDGFMDVAFAIHRTADQAFAARSPLYMGSSLGWGSRPDHEFASTGASDVLLTDLNGDGWGDLVLAQEQDGTTYLVRSALYWGRVTGWSAAPDVELNTTGASDVDACDVDGDGRPDLVFACYRSTSTLTDSLVFLQGPTGFDGPTPSHRLSTRGARAVAEGDIDGDGRPDLVFANSFAGGQTEIDSYVYWGRAGGGFNATPRGLPTVGAEDVEVADLDGDGHLDVVFANALDNTESRSVRSCVYLNDGLGGLPASPSARLPTTGAVAVAVADLDGTGWKDLVFACDSNGTSYSTPSVVYLGGASGWGASPDIALPTVGATDALVARAVNASVGAYVSKAITPEVPSDTGVFHTLRYTATIQSGASTVLRVLDAGTWEVLASASLTTGTHGVSLAEAFRVKEHPSIRLSITFDRIDSFQGSGVDELWLNWTKRVRRAPVIEGLSVASPSVLRMARDTLYLNVSDEYDTAGELDVHLEVRPEGATTWSSTMLGTPAFDGARWAVPIGPLADSSVGWYDVRAVAGDSDSETSGHIEFPRVIEVLNNVPTAPVVRISPEAPTTTMSLTVEVVTPSSDVETSVVYRFLWWRDGAPVDVITGDIVTSALTARGENWTVEVRAFDGIDESPPATAWVVIRNAPPRVRVPLGNPELAEDAVDSSWVDLAAAFEDPDGDELAYRVAPVPGHIRVTIGPATGKVTLEPERDWNGQESITFIASDDGFQAAQTVLVTVTPVNDAPRFTTVNGEPIAADPVHLEVEQGELLVISMGAIDVEGDELVFSVNTTAVELVGATGEMRFQPGNDEIGTLRFALTMYDAGSPSVKVRLNFTIKVVNMNDPPDQPRIVSPRTGERYKANVTFSLIGACSDPDTQYGQGLNFSWYWNGTHLIGWGTSITTNFSLEGTYNITLSVTDGEHTRNVSIEIVILPVEIPTPPPPPYEPGILERTNWVLLVGVLVAILVLVSVGFVVVSKRREERREAEEEVQEKHDALKHMAAEVKATADQMELELGMARAVPKEGGVRTAELEEVTIEQKGPIGVAAMLTTEGMEEGTLTMGPKETEAASKETEQLFRDMSRAETAVPAQDQERMRVDNLKRKYSTAIGRLPYGIPAPDLKGMDWNDLAAALASGQKRALPDGHETTQVKGKWYYSDPSDSSTFLKEHGARSEEERRRAAALAPTMDKSELLAKLEERFIVGDISEEAYRELKRKYEK